MQLRSPDIRPDHRQAWIVAGNIREARRFIAKRREVFGSARVFQSPNQWMGVPEARIVLVGHYTERQDWESLRKDIRALCLLGAPAITVEDERSAAIRADEL